MEIPYHKTQIGKIVESIKLAYVSHTPIVFIATNEWDLLGEILLNTNEIIPRLQHNRNEGEIPIGQDFKERIVDNYHNLETHPDYIQIFDDKRPNLLYCVLSSDREDVWADKGEALKRIRHYLHIYLNSDNSVKIKGDNYLKFEVIDNVRHNILLIIAPPSKVPADLAPYIRLIKVEPLQDEEICAVIERSLLRFDIPISKLPPDILNQMVVNFRGFNKRKISQAIEKMVATELFDFETAINPKAIWTIIRDEKKQILEKSEGLNWEEYSDQRAFGLDAIGQWLNDRVKIFQDIESAKSKNIDIPNGVLVSGIPGSGKSLIAKTAARTFGLPLISMDMGSLLGRFVGESEHNMINALKMAEDMAPCVLWIDEIEKAFSGSDSKSSSSDNGTGRRMFGKFLIWMQEKSAACFVFATSNDITSLPPELFRSERFDKKFFTFMPTAEECSRIFAGNISCQNAKYQEMKEKKFRKGKQVLFEKELEKPEFWKKIIDSSCCPHSGDAELKDSKWKISKRPKNKLLTGADISAIIKEAKFSATNKGQMRDGSVIILAKDMKANVEQVLKTFKPYGETNLKSIVRCFIKLYENEFESASGQCILNFDQFDEDNLFYSAEELNLGNYDRTLYNTMVGAINRYAIEIAIEDSHGTYNYVLSYRKETKK
jgi:SpoVK/Ycf46/Vps4 family AAA+-type ATPase